MAALERVHPVRATDLGIDSDVWRADGRSKSIEDGGRDRHGRLTRERARTGRAASGPHGVSRARSRTTGGGTPARRTPPPLLSQHVLRAGARQKTPRTFE